MTIVKINKDCLIGEDQDSITLNLSDDYLKQESKILLQQMQNHQTESQPSNDQDNPWIKYAGMFKDDPQFDDFLAEIESYRQELDQEL